MHIYTAHRVSRLYAARRWAWVREARAVELRCGGRITWLHVWSSVPCEPFHSSQGGGRGVAVPRVDPALTRVRTLPTEDRPLAPLRDSVRGRALAKGGGRLKDEPRLSPQPVQCARPSEQTKRLSGLPPPPFPLLSPSLFLLCDS